MNTNAAIVVIGDEILSGYTSDINSGWLAKQLFDAGILVQLILTIPDKKDFIIKWVRELSKSHDYVFTTGGIGPTHDDITRETIAEAFNVPLELNLEADKALREYYKDKISESRLSMAYLPRGVELIRNPISAAPGFIIQNVYVFPGIPELLKLMFTQVMERFNYIPYQTIIIKTKLPESIYAKKLFLTAEKFPEVMIGSYPKIFETNYKTEIVIKSKDSIKLKEASDYIQSFVDELHKSESL
jgi:molybdenum cofactor synthesis domain-containing protein